MKKHIAILVLALTLCSCKKYGKPYEAYFYANIDSAKAPLFLFVDGANKGLLPILHTQVSPTNDTITKQALKLSLKLGASYKIEGRDANGMVKNVGTFRHCSSSDHGSGHLGGQASSTGKGIVVYQLSI